MLQAFQLFSGQSLKPLYIKRFTISDKVYHIDQILVSDVSFWNWNVRSNWQKTCAEASKDRTSSARMKQIKLIRVYIMPGKLNNKKRTAIVYFGPERTDYLKLAEAEARSEFLAYIQTPLQAQIAYFHDFGGGATPNFGD